MKFSLVTQTFRSPDSWWPTNVCTTHLLCVQTMPCYCFPYVPISSWFLIWSLVVSSSMSGKLHTHSQSPPPHLDPGELLSQPPQDDQVLRSERWHRCLGRVKVTKTPLSLPGLVKVGCLLAAGGESIPFAWWSKSHAWATGSHLFLCAEPAHLT